MKNLRFLKPALVLLAGSFLASGCVYRERVVYHQPGARVVATETVGSEVVATEAPPPPVLETVTIAPGPGFIWIGGGWVWRNHWYWQRGHWDRPPRAGAVWVPHHYEHRGGVHVFIRGGWR
jgi:hypothetical protein